ncbi:hypothetical protein [Roseisolibacter agri]|uniref:TonB-dependent receptor plug domain-containing protein n=1 Tax=Roseisolibacter agri TaxID=2014610 RepID=A0AA37V134_9BACT|nr:hypothetical protein [Roseisolibacter agri]GLC25555.1 hypothetical protein rosag_20680 [Roseisolibacter agri]
MSAMNGARRRGAPWPVVVLGAACALGVGACGGARATTGAGGGRVAPGARSMAELRAGELAVVRDATSVFNAIERLRPLFFRPRPGPNAVHGSAPELSVYIDGSFAGAPDVLRSLAVQDVQVVRFVQPTQATTTYGTARAADGVIEVTLKRLARE